MTGAGGGVHVDIGAEEVVLDAPPADALAASWYFSKVFPWVGGLMAKTIPCEQCAGGPACLQ